jgi:hypothetical protein
MNTKKWYTSNKTGAQPIIIDEQTGATIAVCYQDKDGNQLENATLIANAPKLLEILEEIVNEIETTPDELSDALLGLIKLKAERAIYEAKDF